MKRFTYGFIMVIMCLILFSCENNNTQIGYDSQTDKTDEGYFHSFDETVFTDVSHVNSHVTIYYPRIIDDSVEAARANQLIYEKITSYPVQFYGNDYMDLTLEISYDLFVWQDYVSIVFKGMGNVLSAAYPNSHYFTMNFSLDSYEPVRLRDLYNVDTAFVELFKNALTQQYDKQKVQFFEAEYTNIQILEMLATCDEDGSFCYSSFSEHKIVVSVPIRHAGGDYLEVAIPIIWLEECKR